MLEQTSKDFRARFLLIFTKEIIENTNTYKNLKIKEKVKEFVIREREKTELPKITEIEKKEEVIREKLKKEVIKEVVRDKIKEESKKISEMRKSISLPELGMVPKLTTKARRKSTQGVTPASTLRVPIRMMAPILRIREPALPHTVSYLKPQPTTEEINLGKINILIKDAAVRVIECNGPEQSVIVVGMMGRKPTPIKLTSSEIEEIVGKFAAVSKIPVHEGLFKAAFGNLVISAVISETVGIKFIIRKIYSMF